MENGQFAKNRLRLLLKFWIIASEAFFFLSLLWWYVAFIFAFETHWTIIAFASLYPLLILISVFMTWKKFKNKTYLGPFLWSILPFLWFIALYLLVTFGP
jgi:hypothetical protein